MTDLAAIEQADKELTDRFRERMVVNHDLDRTLVSFQANRREHTFRWCKYKEGFSAELVRYVLDRVGPRAGRIIDPFAGSGTALFTAGARGLDATGIELLPSSCEIIKVRADVLKSDRKQLADELRRFAGTRVWEREGRAVRLTHLPITAGAYPAESQRQLERYLFESARLRDRRLSGVLRFAALCILESISFTRKDGQYLRWDHRSGRRQGARPFEKKSILQFSEAICDKLKEIAGDIESEDRPSHRPRAPHASEPLRPSRPPLPARPLCVRRGEMELLQGTCLEVLPALAANAFDGLITSPPYCNRYNYTRTYALELAMLGVDQQQIKDLRQAMLSCTVENKPKADLNGASRQPNLSRATEAFASQKMLQRVLEYLEACRADGSLNNPGIPRMVRNYFLESALVIAECARILKPGAPLVMVNDNVRYQGAHVPADLILADFGERLGFCIERIWVLPKGKGNSSQQMGRHGRAELRKCVYVWRKTGSPSEFSSDSP